MKIICIGRNYAAHAKELNNEIPEAPVLFMKPKNAIILPERPLYYPEFTKDLHYECEIVVRICKNGKYISEKFARNYFEEVTVGIDFTARDLQQNLKAKGLPWEIAKAFDGSAAVGSFIPFTEAMQQDGIAFHLDINQQQVQQGHTRDMIYNIPSILSHASKYFTLNIGDYLFTGTPAGVGPVAVNDKLEAFIGEQKLLDLDIK